MRVSHSVIVSATLLAIATACGAAGSSAGSDTTAVGSDSTALSTPTVRTVGALLPGDANVTSTSVRGAIVSISSEDLYGNPVSRVVLEGDGPVEERSFLIALPTEIPSPFSAGDEVVFVVETVLGPPTAHLQNMVVTTVDGELLAMSGVTPPDEWAVAVSGEARRVGHGSYDEIELHLTIAHQGRRVVTDSSRWRLLSTPDGDFYVKGSATKLEGEIPPDGGGTMSFMIVRARPRQPATL